MVVKKQRQYVPTVALAVCGLSALSGAVSVWRGGGLHMRRYWHRGAGVSCVTDAIDVGGGGVRVSRQTVQHAAAPAGILALPPPRWEWIASANPRPPVLEPGTPLADLGFELRRETVANPARAEELSSFSLTLPLYSPVIIAVIWALGWHFERRWELAHQPVGRCPFCGYQMRYSEACPECGQLKTQFG
jgi:hypothetical protein